MSAATRLVEEWEDRQETIQCDGCGTCQPQDQWWTCAECDNMDLCQECHRKYLTGEPLHPPGHAFTSAVEEGDLDLHEMAETDTDCTKPAKRHGQECELFSVPHLARDPLHIPSGCVNMSRGDTSTTTSRSCLG